MHVLVLLLIVHSFNSISCLCGVKQSSCHILTVREKRSLSVVDPGLGGHEGSEQCLHPALPAPERGVVRL